MQAIDSLLSKANDRPLISYRGQTETQRSLVKRVDALVARLQAMTKWPDNPLVIICEEDPISFYALLFALWKNGQRVILPTRDFFSDPQSIDYYQYAIGCRNEEVSVTANPTYRTVAIPETGDVVAFSSGSTGTPKGILHDHGHFIANAQSVCGRVKEQGANSLTFLKPYLVSAVSHLLVHFMTDSHLRFEDYENMPECDHLFAAQPDIGIVGSPMHLVTALQHIPAEAQPRFFFSSGDFLPSACTTRILGTYPDAVVYNVYGLAELAGRFFINRIDATTPADCYETLGTAIEGVRYRLDADQFLVQTDFLFKGYIRSGNFTPADEWHPTQDIVGQDDRGLFLIGRADDEIKILGNKVSLKHIENRIKQILDLDVAVLLASEHPTFGNVLSLVLDARTDLGRTDLIQRLRSRLKPYEIPHRFLALDAVPFTQSMKIDRHAIADRLDALRAIA